MNSQEKWIQQTVTLMKWDTIINFINILCAVAKLVALSIEFVLPCCVFLVYAGSGQARTQRVKSDCALSDGVKMSGL
jgi:hypothetical protein